MGILPPAHDETWVREKRDGKIKIVINQWLKFGAHDDTNMTLHHTFYCPRNAKKYGCLQRGADIQRAVSTDTRRKRCYICILYAKIFKSLLRTTTS